MPVGTEPRAAPAVPASASTRGVGERLRLTVEIFLAYLGCWRELRRVPIEEAVATLRREEAPTGVQGRAELEEAMRLGWIVVRVLRFLPGDTRCLRRSLTLTRLLARRGIEGRLVIAVRAEPDFLAHAWVEHEGVAVLEPAGAGFARLVEL